MSARITVPTRIGRSVKPQDRGTTSRGFEPHDRVAPFRINAALQSPSRCTRPARPDRERPHREPKPIAPSADGCKRVMRSVANSSCHLRRFETDWFGPRHCPTASGLLIGDDCERGAAGLTAGPPGESSLDTWEIGGPSRSPSAATKLSVSHPPRKIVL